MIFFFLYFFFGCDSQIQSPSSRIDTYIQDSSKEHILYIDVYLPEDSKIQEEVIPKGKLTFRRHEPPQEQLIGRMQRTRYQYRLEGDPKSYVIRFDDVTFTDEAGSKESMKIDPLFYDLQSQGPVAQVPDYLKPQKDKNTYYILLFSIPVGIFAFLMYQRNRKRPISILSRKSREELLIEEWDELLVLDEHSQSIGISNLIREYLSEKHGQPLTQFSQSEVLTWLQTTRLPQSIKTHIKNTITATDQLKFSRKGGGNDFFKNLIVSRNKILEYHSNASGSES